MLLSSVLFYLSKIIFFSDWHPSNKALISSNGKQAKIEERCLRDMSIKQILKSWFLYSSINKVYFLFSKYLTFSIKWMFFIQIGYMFLISISKKLNWNINIFLTFIKKFLDATLPCVSCSFFSRLALFDLRARRLSLCDSLSARPMRFCESSLGSSTATSTLGLKG